MSKFIRFECPTCRKRLKTRPESLGGKIKCTGCSAISNLNDILAIGPASETNMAAKHSPENTPCQEVRKSLPELIPEFASSPKAQLTQQTRRADKPEARTIAEVESEIKVKIDPLLGTIRSAEQNIQPMLKEIPTEVKVQSEESFTEAATTKNGINSRQVNKTTIISFAAIGAMLVLGMLYAVTGNKKSSTFDSSTVSGKPNQTSQTSDTSLLSSWQQFVQTSKGRARNAAQGEFDRKDNTTHEVDFYSDDLIRSSSIQNSSEGVIKLKVTTHFGPRTSLEYEYILRYGYQSGKWVLIGRVQKDLKDGSSIEQFGRFFGTAFVLNQVFDM